MYLVNPLSFFTQTEPDLIKGRKVLASAIMNVGVQIAFNQAKGAIPARIDIDLSAMAACALETLAALAANDAGGKAVPTFAGTHAASSMKSYGAVKVLHQVDVTVEKGEFLVLVAPSGCGKFTLSSMIAGLEGIISGKILIKGRVMNGVHRSKRNIAMVFQSCAIYPNMTMGQSLTFGHEMHGVPRPARDTAFRDAGKVLQIEDPLDRKPGQLSGGQRQRVAMGRALERNPDVFLLDEPLSNLEAKLRAHVRTAIKKLHQKPKSTFVYVTHDQIEAMTLSARIAVLYQVCVQQLGMPKETCETAANVHVATFIGNPAMNVLPATAIVQHRVPHAGINDANGV